MKSLLLAKLSSAYWQILNKLMLTLLNFSKLLKPAAGLLPIDSG
jgi:hypothetical protein